MSTTAPDSWWVFLVIYLVTYALIAIMMVCAFKDPRWFAWPLYIFMDKQKLTQA
jgi:hypothetical protein